MSPASTQTTAVTKQIEVIEFLSRELAMDKSKIWPSSRLRQDLRVDGADAMQLIEAFSVAFEVDTDDFRFTDYFAPAAMGRLYALDLRKRAAAQDFDRTKPHPRSTPEKAVMTNLTYS